VSHDSQDRSYRTVAHVHNLPNPKGHNSVNQTEIQQAFTAMADDLRTALALAMSRLDGLTRSMAIHGSIRGDERLTKADYVQFGEHRIRVVEDSSIPADTFYAIGSCSCGHPAFSHDNLGCNRRIGSCDICPCAVDVSTLATKTTGIGGQR
jgi:hypothetical protein